MTDWKCMLTVISLWDKEIALREIQRDVLEKEEIMKTQAQQIAQDQERIAALEAELAFRNESALRWDEISV